MDSQFWMNAAGLFIGYTVIKDVIKWFSVKDMRGNKPVEQVIENSNQQISKLVNAITNTNNSSGLIEAIKTLVEKQETFNDSIHELVVALTQSKISDESHRDTLSDRLTVIEADMKKIMKDIALINDRTSECRGGKGG